MPKSRNEPYRIVVAPQDKAAILGFYRIMCYHILRREDIPYAVAEGFLRRLYDENLYKQEQVEKLLYEKSEAMAERLQKQKGYTFKWRWEAIENNKTALQSSTTSQVIYHILSAYEIFRAEQEELKKRELDKDDAIDFFYAAIQEYRRHLSKAQQKALNEYKMRVYTAYLMQSTDFKLIGKSKPTNHQLQIAVRDALNRIKKANKGFTVNDLSDKK